MSQTKGVVVQVSEEALAQVKDEFRFAYSGSEYAEDDPAKFLYVVFRSRGSIRLISKIDQIHITVGDSKSAVFDFSRMLVKPYVDTIEESITRLRDHNINALHELFKDDDLKFLQRPDELAPRLTLKDAKTQLANSYGVGEENIEISITV